MVLPVQRNMPDYMSMERGLLGPYGQYIDYMQKEFQKSKKAEGIKEPRDYYKEQPNSQQFTEDDYAAMLAILELLRGSGEAGIPGPRPWQQKAPATAKDVAKSGGTESVYQKLMGT